MKDLRSILRPTCEQGLSVRAIPERLQISQTSVATYAAGARSGLDLAAAADLRGRSDNAAGAVPAGRAAPQDLGEPDWARVAQELKRKGVTLTLLWQEYRAVHPDDYGYTWICERFAASRRRANPTFRHRHAAGAVMQTDYAGWSKIRCMCDPSVGRIDTIRGDVRQQYSRRGAVVTRVSGISIARIIQPRSRKRNMEPSMEMHASYFARTSRHGPKR